MKVETFLQRQQYHYGTGTKRQYSTYIRKWTCYCRKRQINYIQSTLHENLDFLTALYENSLSYSAINSARSALSSFGIVNDGVTFGSHPVVIRFMKGIYNLRLPMPKYIHTWDVSIVLKEVRRLSPVKYLTLKNLKYKLIAMLICLIIAGRTQSLHLLSIQNMIRGTYSYIYNIVDH